MANVQLTFNMQHQVETNWCWAATAASVSKYYDAGSHWTQCLIAGNCLTKTCCPTPTAAPCNVAWFLNRALATTGNFVSKVDNALSIVEIQSEIDVRKVIGVRIGWKAGGGHFVVIHGYNDTGGSTFLHVEDPWYGKSYIDLTAFTDRYKSSGSWTHSYFTDSNTGGNMLSFTHIDDQLLGRIKSFTPDFLLNDQNYKNKNFELADNKAVPMAVPHDVYVINFDDLLGSGPSKIMTKVGVRLVDQTPQGYLTYEFDGPDGNAKLREVIQGERFNQGFINALNKALTVYGDRGDPFKVDIVQQPELKVEALWIHSDRQVNDDGFIPVFDNGFLDSDIVYPGESFIGTLRQNARNREINDDTLLGGS